MSKNSGPFNSGCGLLCMTEGPGCILVDKFASSIRVRVVVFIATLGVQGLIFLFFIFLYLQFFLQALLWKFGLCARESILGILRTLRTHSFCVCEDFDPEFKISTVYNK